MPANADGERLWLVPSPAKGFFYLVGAKNVKNIRKTKENDLQMMGDDGLYSSIHVLKGIPTDWKLECRVFHQNFSFES